MTISRKSLYVVYALTGVVALVGTWGNNIQYLNQGMAAANVQFWRDTLVNPASRSITVDLLLLSFVAIVWMLLEARRLSMRGAWIYVLVGAFVSISISFPVFLINRERVLAKRDGSTRAGILSTWDILGVAFLSLSMLAYTFAALAK